MSINKKELWRAVKYTLFAISAGVIQIVSSLALKAILDTFMDENRTMVFIREIAVSSFVAETVGLALSIVWNLTFNRKFTFKAANNVPIAMLLAFAFYVPFYPFQTWYIATVEEALAGIGFWGYVVAQGTVMIINFVLEFLWQRFVVFRGKVDTNDIAQKQAQHNAEFAADALFGDETPVGEIATDELSDTETVDADFLETARCENLSDK